MYIYIYILKYNRKGYTNCSTVSLFLKIRSIHETKIVDENDLITTEVKRNDRKLPVHWSSNILKWYKRNAIVNDLTRATRIVSFPADEIPKIKMLTIRIGFSIVALITFKKNQRKLTTSSFPLVSLVFQRRLY